MTGRWLDDIVCGGSSGVEWSAAAATLIRNRQDTRGRDGRRYITYPRCRKWNNIQFGYIRFNLDKVCEHETVYIHIRHIIYTRDCSWTRWPHGRTVDTVVSCDRDELRRHCRHNENEQKMTSEGNSETRGKWWPCDPGELEKIVRHR